MKFLDDVPFWHVWCITNKGKKGVFLQAGSDLMAIEAAIDHFEQTLQYRNVRLYKIEQLDSREEFCKQISTIEYTEGKIEWSAED